MNVVKDHVKKIVSKAHTAGMVGGSRHVISSY